MVGASGLSVGATSLLDEASAQDNLALVMTILNASLFASGGLGVVAAFRLIDGKRDARWWWLGALGVLFLPTLAFALSQWPAEIVNGILTADYRSSVGVGLGSLGILSVLVELFTRRRRPV